MTIIAERNSILNITLTLFNMSHLDVRAAWLFAKTAVAITPEKAFCLNIFAEVGFPFGQDVSPLIQV